jgi:hypothetical protein
MTFFPLDLAVIFILKDVTSHPTLRALWLSDPLPTAQSVKRRADEVSVFHPLQFMSLFKPHYYLLTDTLHKHTTFFLI